MGARVLKLSVVMASSVLYGFQLALRRIYSVLRFGFMEAEAVLAVLPCKQREFTRLACEWRVLLLTKLCFDCALYAD